MRHRAREHVHGAPEDFARSKAMVHEMSRRALNKNRLSRASRAGSSPLRTAAMVNEMRLAVHTIKEAEERKENC